MSDSKARFEAKFPKPANVFFQYDKYRAQDAAYEVDAEKYQAMWLVFRAMDGQAAQATPPSEPVGYIGVDTFTALSGGETVVQCITPYRHMETDVAIYTTPPAVEPVAWIAPHRLKELSTGMPQTVFMKATNSDTVPLYTTPPASPDMVSPTPKIRAFHTASGYFSWSWPSVGVGELSYRTKSDGEIEFSAENMNAYRVRQLLHAFADVLADEYADQIWSAK